MMPAGLLPVDSNRSWSVISKGVSEPRAFISGRVALRDLLFTLLKQKVPRPYWALEMARPHRRELGMTICYEKQSLTHLAVQTVPFPPKHKTPASTA